MLDAKLTILELAQEGNLFGWLPYHSTWGSYELKQSRNIFSSVAMGARTVEITMRKQPITLDNSILRGERQLYITQIDDTADPHFTTVTAALLDPVSCSVSRETSGKNELNRVVRTKSVTLTFPAWLTEKYVGRQQADPQVVIDTMYILITPKAVELNPGELVTVEAQVYTVWVAHTLDGHKNEYEISRKVEP